MEETEANPSKFVIRKLPPNLCEADFHKLLTDVCQDELEWFRYHPGSFTCALRLNHLRRLLAYGVRVRCASDAYHHAPNRVLISS